MVTIMRTNYRQYVKGLILAVIFTTTMGGELTAAPDKNNREFIAKIAMGKNWVHYTLTKEDGSIVKLKGHGCESLIDWVGYKARVEFTGTKIPATQNTIFVKTIKKVSLVEAPVLMPLDNESHPHLNYQEIADVYNSIKRIRDIDRGAPFYGGPTSMGPKRSAEDMKRLNWLMLSGTDVTDELFAKLSQLPNTMKVLKLRYCDNLTVKSAASFKNIRHIKYMALDAPFWTPELLLKSMKNTTIESMTFVNHTIDETDPFWKDVLADHPDLKFKFRQLAQSKMRHPTKRN